MTALKSIRKITNITKLRSFQYRLLHNKIFCNNVLYHWKKVASQKCDFCDVLKQTPYHLFISCRHAAEIWEQLAEYLDEYGFNFEVKAKNIILNNYEDRIVNFLVLVVKQLLYRHKCQQKTLNWKQVLREIENLYQLEMFNAVSNNKINIHVEKWKYLRPECTLIKYNCKLNTHV